MSNFKKYLLKTVALLTVVKLTACVTVSAQENERSQLRFSLSPSPAITTTDGLHGIRVAGFMQFDHVQSFCAENDWTESKIRRARLGVRGHVDKVWKYDLMFEAGSGEAQLFDANITYSGLDFADIRMGQFKEPIGLEWSTGAPWWTFNDRALVASLTPKRSVGFTLSKNTDRWGAYAGYFGSESTINKSPPEDGVMLGRVYFLPYKKGKNVMHLGFSLQERSPEEGSVRIKAKHETAGQPYPSVDTGTISEVSSVGILGIESLFKHGPFSLQGEYYEQYIKRGEAPDVNLSSAYIQASLILTGEQRPYKVNKGGFGRISPYGSNGAIELATRIDSLDASDRIVDAGKLDRLTIGLNWYVNKNIRLTTNYVYSKTNEAARISDADFHSIGFRTQFTF